MDQVADDADTFLQKKTDLDHVKQMSQQMRVPDSIIVGPPRTTFPRIDPADHLQPVHMEVPARLRPGGNGSVVELNERDFYGYDATNSRPNTDNEASPTSDNFHSHRIIPSANSGPTFLTQTSENQPNGISTSWHVEPVYEVDDKNILNKIQLLQNRVYQLEHTVARRQRRDNLFYTCVIGYVLLQVLLSVRRSMLN